MRAWSTVVPKFAPEFLNSRIAGVDRIPTVTTIRPSICALRVTNGTTTTVTLGLLNNRQRKPSRGSIPGIVPFSISEIQIRRLPRHYYWRDPAYSFIPSARHLCKGQRLSRQLVDSRPEPPEMSPPATIEDGPRGDSCANPLTVDGVASWRAKTAKIPATVAPAVNSDMFKSPVRSG